MVQFKSIPLDQIVVPERLRAVEEEHALAIAQSIVEHGLINPITVRHTPNAKGGSYTLVAGAHRLRACQINKDAEIEATVVEGDKTDAQLIEITENLFRNDLSVIDRAVFVQTYRDVWEAKFGKVEAGRPGNRANLSQLLEQEAEAGSFSLHVADRMGVSRRAVERLNKIAKSLHPDVRTAVRGTPTADNQSELLKIAKMEPTRQRQFAAAMGIHKDSKKAFTEVVEVQPKAELTEDDKFKLSLVRLQKAWEEADEAACIEFLKGLLHDPDGLLSSFVNDHFDVEGMRDEA
ncbi:ParB/RepB/Spo0J family partition protein [Oryzifoliimicrobium ureilyticus]|uniref:ParB/RepB/Spo0J family partition protein n=1 Tax=Oryzifoliimicrobium ureilyticus TaxID=3113724 RepID=UPI003075FC59